MRKANELIERIVYYRSQMRRLEREVLNDLAYHYWLLIRELEWVFRTLGNVGIMLITKRSD